MYSESAGRDIDAETAPDFDGSLGCGFAERML